jgi:hypothetical protein|eukprot:CAMPEP_0169217762 /NCGR_PEP_ID=MMETSP1016-20121227/19078_1 /TAXON_ID=342587 /ORGANISM="Karlodinium micrum, Strain CCMP2283" /LENGTH=165 /DNA_ID=CAMNT_0009295705 /DNA_START=1736 /DNA_END=2233 /DNA_ORIENTATION=+
MEDSAVSPASPERKDSLIGIRTDDVSNPVGRCDGKEADTGSETRGARCWWPAPLPVTILLGANGTGVVVVRLLESPAFHWKLPAIGDATMLLLKELWAGVPTEKAATVGEAIATEDGAPNVEETAGELLCFSYPLDCSSMGACRFSACLYWAGSVTIETPAWLMD